MKDNRTPEQRRKDRIAIMRACGYYIRRSGTGALWGLTGLTMAASILGDVINGIAGTKRKR